MTNPESQDEITVVDYFEDDYEVLDEAETFFARPRPPAGPSQVYSIRIPVERLAEVRAVAERAKKAPTALIREWVLERLDVELASVAQAVDVGDNDEVVEGSWGLGKSHYIDVDEGLTAAALSPSGIGALKTVAQRMKEYGAINVAVLLFGLSGERDPKVASNDFGRAGALAYRNRRYVLAEVAWERSVAVDPTNLRSLSLLGQVKHHRGKFQDAIRYLTDAASVDEYAELFLGRSEIELGRSKKDRELISHGVGHLTNALRRWAYHAKPHQRNSWLRHVADLQRLGGYEQEVEQLCSYANGVAPWKPIFFDTNVLLYEDLEAEDGSPKASDPDASQLRKGLASF